MNRSNATTVQNSKRKQNKNSRWNDKAWTEAAISLKCVSQDHQTCLDKCLRIPFISKTRWILLHLWSWGYTNCVKQTCQPHQLRLTWWRWLNGQTVTAKCVRTFSAIWLRRRCSCVICITPTFKRFTVWLLSRDFSHLLPSLQNRSVRRSKVS